MVDVSTTTQPEPQVVLVGSWRERALEDARDFIGELGKLRETDRGRMAQLRRNAGETLPGRGTVWFYQHLYSPRRQRFAEIHFLVATLFDLNRKPSVPGDFGHALQVLAHKMRPNDKPEEASRRFRRFHILVDSEFDRIHDPLNEIAPWQEGGGELAFRLRQVVKLLAAKEVGVDWARLLVDLSQWSHPSKCVQKQWARSFFCPRLSDQTSTPDNAGNPAEPLTE